MFFFSFLLLLENLLHLTPTLLALIDVISIIKDLFCASVYTGLNCPTPTLLIFQMLLNFVPFSSEVPRFCVSAETKLFLNLNCLSERGFPADSDGMLRGANDREPPELLFSK